jgi:hypothetical protein
MSFTLVRVTSQWKCIDGTIPTGTVTFSLSCDISDGVSLFYTLDSCVRTLDGEGCCPPISIPANDDPTTRPSGSYYIVTEDINGNTRTYFVVVPHTAPGGTISLAALAPYVPE